jgi:hypothetical protein
MVITNEEMGYKIFTHIIPEGNKLDKDNWDVKCRVKSNTPITLGKYKQYTERYFGPDYNIDFEFDTKYQNTPMTDLDMIIDDSVVKDPSYYVYVK